jgi:hypothetical protein
MKGKGKKITKNNEKWKKIKKKGNLLLFFQGILADNALHNSKHSGFWATSCMYNFTSNFNVHYYGKSK